MPKSEEENLLFKALMEIVTNGRWQEFEISELSDRSGVQPSEIGEKYRDKNSILVAFAEYIDRQTLEALDEEIKSPAIPVRERLLEVLLVRFDVLTPYKAGIVELLKQAPKDPAMLITGSKSLKKSMCLSLEAVGLSSAGISGMLKIKGLGAVFLLGLNAWSRDESDNLDVASRILDERLKLIENFVISIGLVGK